MSSTPAPMLAWPPTDADVLVINICSQGQWASFLATKSMVDCLMRPGVLDFSGEASLWLESVPKLSSELYDEDGVTKSRAGRVLDAHQSFMAPFDYGLMIIDYDTKTASAMQDYGRPFTIILPNWGFRTKNAAHAERQWLQNLSRTGYLKEALWDDGSITPLPMPPLDVLNPALWWERELRAIKGLPPPPLNTNPFETFVTFALEPPGWAWGMDTDRDQAQTMFLALHPQLNPAEIAAWQNWAQAQEVPQLLEVMRRMGQEQQLEALLPVPAVSGSTKPRM